MPYLVYRTFPYTHMIRIGLRLAVYLYRFVVSSKDIYLNLSSVITELTL